jgi:hypothetical protein
MWFSFPEEPLQRSANPTKRVLDYDRLEFHTSALGQALPYFVGRQMDHPTNQYKFDVLVG